jgi:hypothetical protein
MEAVSIKKLDYYLGSAVDIKALHSIDNSGVDAVVHLAAKTSVYGALMHILTSRTLLCYSGYIKCTRILQVEEYQKIHFHELICLR